MRALVLEIGRCRLGWSEGEVSFGFARVWWTRGSIKARIDNYREAALRAAAEASRLRRMLSWASPKSANRNERPAVIDTRGGWRR